MSWLREFLTKWWQELRCIRKVPFSNLASESCAYIKKDGKNCVRPAAQGSIYCTRHRALEREAYR